MMRTIFSLFMLALAIAWAILGDPTISSIWAVGSIILSQMGNK